MKPIHFNQTSKLVILSALTALLPACATSPVKNKLGAESIAQIKSAEHGGAIINYEGFPVPCSTGSVSFYEKTSGESISAGFGFAMFGMSNTLNVISMPPGQYYPKDGACSHYYESGGFGYTRNYDYKIRPGSQKPLTIEAGKVTNPGSYKFTGSYKTGLSFTYLDDKAELLEKALKKHSELEFISNP